MFKRSTVLDYSDWLNYVKFTKSFVNIVIKRASVMLDVKILCMCWKIVERCRVSIVELITTQWKRQESLNSKWYNFNWFKKKKKKGKKNEKHLIV